MSEDLSPQQATALIGSRSFASLLLLSGVVGVVVSIASWLFLEGTFQLQRLLFDEIPSALGLDAGEPALWYLALLLALAGVIVAFAITRLPGGGGHVPAFGLATGGATAPAELPGVLLAAVGTIGFGLVLGPEAPLIALGSGLAIASLGLAKRDVAAPATQVVAAAGSFAALSFVFESPVIAAVILIEAAALGGTRQRIVLIPGLLAAGIGSLVSIGFGSLAGLSSSDYALGALPLPAFERPDAADFAWTVVLAPLLALATLALLRLGRAGARAAASRPFAVLPAIGVTVALLAFGFGAATDHGSETVLLSGQDALPGLVSDAGSWSAGALALLLLAKGLAYSLSLGGFRGGPTFPALFLGAAAGLLVDGLPGFGTTPAVAVGMAAAAVTVLELPLSTVVLCVLLTAQSGPGTGPLVILAVVLAHLLGMYLRARAQPPEAVADPQTSAAPAPA
jgi:H+/Cl- antiporter ClcA